MPAAISSSNKQHIAKTDPRQLVVVQSYRPTREKGDYNDDVTAFEQRLDRKQILAPIPEQVAISTGNAYDQTFDILQFKQTVVNWISKGAGKKFTRGISERQYWDGIENQEITLELEFAAYNSGYWDVVVPCRNLMMLATPTERGSTDISTNDVEGIENLTAHWDEPPHIMVSIGDFLTLNNVGISNCSVSFSNKLDNEFMPLSATASVSFVMIDPFGSNTIVSEMMPWRSNGNGDLDG